MHPATVKLVTLAAALPLFIESVLARPNFVFVLTDDQDVHMDSLDYMPEVQQHLIAKGAQFDKHYCTGGYQKFINNGYNDHHLALWLQEAGYNTYYGGKLFNGHTTRNYNRPHMSGYTDSAFFLEPYTYQYSNVSYSRNGGRPINPVGRYSTDLLSNLTQQFIGHAIRERKPFFITVAPIAPHGRLNQWPRGAQFGPPVPAARHRGLFDDYIIPRTDNFNPEQPSSVNWIAELPQLNDTIIQYNDEFQRLRMRSLLSVDEMVGDIVRRLEREGVVDDTYIIYSSDNGFHISQHRLHPGKMCGLETDINVPMIIRGPGIRSGSIQSAPSSHTDVAPTILQLAGIDTSNKKLDGAPMDLEVSIDGYNGTRRTEHIGVEFWGSGLDESFMATERGGSRRHANNTYKGLRVEAEDYGFYYSVWCNNAKELYDMKRDPGQLDNLLSPSRPNDESDFSLFDQGLDAVVDRLDAMLMVLKSCREDSCRDPWGTLHPGSDVMSLGDALSRDFDSFYLEQPKVAFTRCVNGQLLDAEGPTEFNVYTAGGQDDRDDGDESMARMLMLDIWSWGGLALHKCLQLPWPTKPAKEPFHIFIYGGTTAMGISAIQIAKLSGGTVITTSSPSNADYLRSLERTIFWITSLSPSLKTSSH
ncbi:hypothetical protein S40293_00644 [Stachybotrys chartarum IBT 40293]|nr:hypothetical protein S40293_00644 [Stachybotrys chartarum IBT 40293]